MTINVGIIGLGYWGPNLVQNSRATREGKVVICCDLNSQNTARRSCWHTPVSFSPKRQLKVLGHPTGASCSDCDTRAHALHSGKTGAGSRETRPGHQAADQ